MVIKVESEALYDYFIHIFAIKFIVCASSKNAIWGKIKTSPVKTYPCKLCLLCRLIFPN